MQVTYALHEGTLASSSVLTEPLLALVAGAPGAVATVEPALTSALAAGAADPRRRVNPGAQPSLG
jgi:hypothetical protein